MAPLGAVSHRFTFNYLLDYNTSYADDIYLIGDIGIIERNAEVLLNTCKDIGLAVNTVETK